MAGQFTFRLPPSDDQEEVTSAFEHIRAALHEQRSEAEYRKIARRLPTDGDLEVIGVRMKEVFDLAKGWTSLSLEEVSALLTSSCYEMQMVGFAVLDFKARGRRVDDAERRALYELYMNHHDNITAWDFVDRAAPRVVGWYLLDKSREPLFDLARSDDALKRRTAITAAFWIIRAGDLEEPLQLIEMLLRDESELVTRPVGTALREVGKIDEGRLVDFLHQHRGHVPRSVLRMASERLSEETRSELLHS